MVLPEDNDKQEERRDEKENKKQETRTVKRKAR